MVYHVSRSISNILPAFHSGMSPCQNLLLEGSQYVVDIDKGMYATNSQVSDEASHISDNISLLQSYMICE